MSLFWLVFFGSIVFGVWRWLRHMRRRAFIAGYVFPERVGRAVVTRYPHLTDRQAGEVVDGLREYFHLCNLAGRRMVAMPSEVVDTAWHEFILFTRNYELFCRRGFGRFLHHTPAEAMRSPTQAQEGIKRAWRLACFRERINAHKPTRLPRLFALDASLAIPGGFTYALNCAALTAAQDGSTVYCCSDIGCSSGCSGGCSGDSGSGCGGGGCGGGGD